jgi:acyl transferase domain-containing protein
MHWLTMTKIDGTILYPGAGMLVMAIEAAKQVAEHGRAIDGFNIQEAKFNAAMRVPSGAHGVETNFYLRPTKGMESKTSGWFEFRLCTYDNDAWTENCNGTIQIVYTSSDTDSGIEKRHEEELWNSKLESYSDAVKSCTLPVNGSTLYDRLQESGYGYGEAFQLVKSASLSPEQPVVIANVQIFSSSAGETIHPTTLDAILQTSIWTTVASETESIPTTVPISVESLWVSSRLLATTSSNVLRTHATRNKESTFLGASVDIIAFDEALEKTLVSVQGLGTNVVSDTKDSGDQGVVTVDVCHHFQWRPDPNLHSNRQLIDLCRKGNTNLVEPGDFFTDLDFVFMARIIVTLQTLSEKGITPSKPHLQKYVEWMEHQRSMLEEGQHWLSTKPWKSRLADTQYVQTIETRLLNLNKRCLVYVPVVQNLLNFLTGDMDPLVLMFEGNKLKDFYYEEVSFSAHIHNLANKDTSFTSPMVSSSSAHISLFYPMPIPG